MSTTRIRIVVDFDIYDGKLDELEAIAKQMVADIEQEPGTLCFHFVLSADRKRCRLIEGYADQAAITAHFIEGRAVHQHIFQLQQVALPTRMEVYGDPGPKVAAMAADFAVEIFTGWIGFDR
jgi:quinol monooxygenase YgiN